MDKILRKPDVIPTVGLSDATVWRLERAGKFPKRIQLGGNSVGWLESEIIAWLEKKRTNVIHVETRRPPCSPGRKRSTLAAPQTSEVG